MFQPRPGTATGPPCLDFVAAKKGADHTRTIVSIAKPLCAIGIMNHQCVTQDLGMPGKGQLSA
jgi:hypothetical protein